MFSSATRVSLLLLLISLIGINIFALIYYPDTVFKDVFAVLNTTVVAVTSYFFGKSSQDSGKPSGQLVEKEESKIDPFSV